jgi:hypothetical protein
VIHGEAIRLFLHRPVYLLDVLFDLWGHPSESEPSLITERHSLWVLNGEWWIREVPFYEGEYRAERSNSPIEYKGRIEEPSRDWRKALERAMGGVRTMNAWERVALAEDTF